MSRVMLPAVPLLASLGLLMSCSVSSPSVTTSPSASSALPQSATPSPQAADSSSLAATPLPEAGDLPPGTYDWPLSSGVPRGMVFRDERLLVTVPSGWAASEGMIHKNINQPGEVALGVWGIDEIYDDPCSWQSSSRSTRDLRQLVFGFDEIAIGSTVVEPVEGGLSNQVGRDASELTKVELGGVPALRVELTTPAEFDLAACDQGEFRSWTATGGGDAPDRQAPGQIDVVYLSWLEPIRLAIVASHLPAASAADQAELDAIVASMVFEE